MVVVVVVVVTAVVVGVAVVVVGYWLLVFGRLPGKEINTTLCLWLH